MMTSIDNLFLDVPLLDTTIFSYALQRGTDTTNPDAFCLTQRIVRAPALTAGNTSQLTGNASELTDAERDVQIGRSLIFIPREPIPYRQLTSPDEESGQIGQKVGQICQKSAQNDVNTGEIDLKTGQIGQKLPDLSSKSTQNDSKVGNFVLEIKRKEGLRTLWQDTPPIRASGLAMRLTRTELELQENIFELLTSEASYGQSLYIVLTHLFNVDCQRSREVVVHSENTNLASENCHNSFSNLTDATNQPQAQTGIVNQPQTGTINQLQTGTVNPLQTETYSDPMLKVAREFERLVKPLDRKALRLNLDALHRHSVSLLDAMKQRWIADSCIMKAGFIQVLAERLSDAQFRADYLAYLRDVRYQQELLHDLRYCARTPLCNASNNSNTVPISGTTANTEVPNSTQNPAMPSNTADEHLCVAERYSRTELDRVRALLNEFHSLKCVENRALQFFLLLPLERLAKLKMCLNRARNSCANYR